MSTPFDKPITYNDGTTKVNIDLSRFGTQTEAAQYWLDNEVIKDCDDYVPMDTGTLKNSALTATERGSGVVVYDTPYARRCYYGDGFNFSQAHHPKAQSRWFEAAKAVNKTRWVSIVKKKAGGGV